MEPGSVSGKPPDGQQVIKRLKIRKYFLYELILLTKSSLYNNKTNNKKVIIESDIGEKTKQKNNNNGSQGAAANVALRRRLSDKDKERRLVFSFSSFSSSPYWYQSWDLSLSPGVLVPESFSIQCNSYLACTKKSKKASLIWFQSI